MATRCINTFKNRIYVLLTVFLLTPTTSTAISVLPLNLNQLYAHASYVIYAKCVDNKKEFDSSTGWNVSYTTFVVLESYKGNLQGTHTIKQISGTSKNAVLEIPGIPSFKTGAEYILFLYKPSSSGFSSPVALEQGRFTILPGKAGKIITNGRAATQLLSNMPRSMLPPETKLLIDSPLPAKKEGKQHIGLNDFKAMLHSIRARSQ